MKRRAYEKRQKKKQDTSHSLESLMSPDTQVGHAAIKRIVASDCLSHGSRALQMRQYLQTMAARGQEYTEEGGADFLLRAASHTDLMKAIQDFKGAVLVVSHDEHLLTSACNELWVVGGGRAERFRGTFAQYKKEVIAGKR